MRTDTTVKTHPVLAVHLGDANASLDSLTFTPDEINRALERDERLGVPLREKVIRPFNKPGMEVQKVQKGPTSIRKRVVAVYLSCLPKDLADSIVRGMFFNMLL